MQRTDSIVTKSVYHKLKIIQYHQSAKMISLDKPQIICHIENSLNYSVYDVKWIPSSARFVALGSLPSGAGIVQIYALNQGKLDKISEFSKANSFKCGTFSASSLRTRHLATGDFKGRLQIWDLENTLSPVHSFSKHKDIINAIDGVAGTSIGCGAPELATGSRDGTVMVWDVRQKNEPVAKMEPSDNTTKRDCWAVAFGNSYNSEQRIVCAGYDNGDIKMYDLRTNSIRWETNVKNGVCGLQFDRRDIPMNKLVATTLESKIHVYDVRTQHPKKGFARLTEKGHNSTVWFVKHLPQNREIFMTAGGSGSLCLWKYEYPEKRVEKDGDGIPYGIAGNLNLLQNFTLSTQPISSFDWCADKPGLAVSSAFDQTIRVLITTKLNLQ